MGEREEKLKTACSDGGGCCGAETRNLMPLSKTITNLGSRKLQVVNHHLPDLHRGNKIKHDAVHEAGD